MVFFRVCKAKYGFYFLCRTRDKCVTRARRRRRRGRTRRRARGRAIARHADDTGQRQRVVDRDDVALARRRCPKSWRAYFPDVSYEENDRRAELSRALATFFASSEGRAFVREVRAVDARMGEAGEGGGAR